MLKQIELRDYETTLLRVLYDRDDMWLKTPQQIVRWLAYCRANAHTKAEIQTILVKCRLRH
jgi:hypothetical protein